MPPILPPDSSIFGLLSDFVGSVGVLVALVLTAYATRSASKSAEIALQALGADRAWIVIESVDDITLTNATIRGEFCARGFAFRAAAANVGNTPALNVDLYSEGRVIGVDDPLPTFVPEISRESRAVIGMGQKGGAHIFAPSPSEFPGIYDGNLCVALYVCVTYHDVFSGDTIRKTEFSARIKYDGQFSEDGKKFRDRFDIRTEGSQNTLS